ncbi:ribokinase [Paenibacillus yanchengensis]|uniref:Ribokinase n=1 Tax=Paenibacillus yanchengensis TaxID=2035833 RepID=A0ABW4YI59_9BACL
MNKPNIAVVGSLNMDLVVTVDRMPKIGETLPGESLKIIPGGKGANQAISCAKLGADVSMIGALGHDAFGEQILTQLNNHHMTTDYIAITKQAQTGTATILHTKEDNCIVAVPGANDHCTSTWITTQDAVWKQSDVLLVQLEIPISSVQTALELARLHQVKTIVNPAPAKPLSDEMLALADVFTPNETEFEFYCQSTITSEEELFFHMKRWQQKYDQQLLIVTRGKHGVSYVANNEIVTVHAPKNVAVVDTTGAGDCLNGALAYAIANDWELQDCLVFAVEAASLSVTKFGAQAGMPTLEEVQQRVALRK